MSILATVQTRRSRKSLPESFGQFVLRKSVELGFSETGLMGVQFLV